MYAVVEGLCECRCILRCVVCGRKRLPETDGRKFRLSAQFSFFGSTLPRSTGLPLFIIRALFLQVSAVRQLVGYEFVPVLRTGLMQVERNMCNDTIVHWK